MPGRRTKARARNSQQGLTARMGQRVVSGQGGFIGRPFFVSSWRLRPLSDLTILFLMCLLVVGAAQAQSATDYDDDNKGLIEIDSLPLAAR